MTYLVTILGGLFFFLVLTPLRGMMGLLRRDPMDLRFKARPRASFFKPVRQATVSSKMRIKKDSVAPVAQDETAAPDTIYPLW